MSELYFSTDIESDGPIPGRNSMLSFGCAVFTAQGQMISNYSANLNTLDGAVPDKDTMEWWSKQPEAWAACRKNTRDVTEVMLEFVKWVNDICNGFKPVFVGYPTGFDYMFMYWYMIAFAGESPFSFSALDIKTLAMAALKINFRDATKKNFPKRWFSNKKHNHVALDDAIEQGELFCNILKDIRNTNIKALPFAQRGYAPRQGAPRIMK